MLKLLVFDWDGTIANSVNKIIACKTFLAKKYGLITPSEAVIRSVLGMRFESAMAKCFPKVHIDTLLKLSQEFKDLMQTGPYQADLFPNIKDLLITFKSQGYKLAIATSKSRFELEAAIEHTGLINIFDATCCSEEYDAKPLPKMLHYLMEIFKVTPDESLMFGDTIIDIQFARNAGVKTIGVTFGAHTDKQLRSQEPLALINNWYEIWSILSQIRNNKRCYQNQLLSYLS